MPDGTLEFDTKIDQSGFNKGVESLNTAAASAGNIMKGFLGANLFQAAGEKLLDFAKKSIQLASDLEEVQNVVDVTFGDGASEINQFAKEASASFGLTELQAKQFTGTIGAMVKSMGVTEAEALDMSTSLTGLAGDLASFYNLDHEEAFNKIRSGISGETEPLKQLGINMSVANLEAYALSKGLKKAYEDMSEAEKVQLRYGYIMEQTTDAQGDFVRTQDGYANQVRMLQNNLDTLSANVGSLLVPALSTAVGWLNDLFNGPATDETTTKINEAITALGTMDEDVSKIKNDYAAEAIKIRVDFEEAQQLTDEFFALKEALAQGFGDRTLKLGMTGADVAALQEQLVALGYAVDLANEVGVFGETTDAALKQYQSDMGLVVDGVAGVNTYAALAAGNTQLLAEKTAELVAIYPELEQYVGEDGVLTLEQSQVEKLIDSYHELAITKAMQGKLAGLEEEYIENAATLKSLEGERKLIEQEKAALEEAREERDKAFDAVEKAYTGSIAYGVQDVGAAAAALDQWIGAYGGIGEVREMLDASGKEFDLSSIIGADGMVVDAAQIEKDTEALNTLKAVLEELYLSGDENALDADIANKQAQLDEINAAITEYTPKVENLYAEYEREKAAVEAAMEDLTGEGTTVGEDTADTIAQGLVDNTVAVTTAVQTLAASMQEEANRNKITIPVGVGTASRPVAHSHATGIDRVPYDNYLARLHVGESVLSAAEAKSWREGKSGIDYSQLAAAMTAAQSSAERTPIVLEIDGKVLAEAQVANNRAALNSRSIALARGYGK